MIVLFVIAIVGGAASVLTPCVLPLLPAILVISRDGGRTRAWGIAAGIELSFFLLALLLAGTITAIGLPPNTLRWVAAVLLAIFGMVLIVPRLESAYATLGSRITSRVPRGPGDGSFASGFLSGIPLGLVWAPCAGPILAGISVAASASRFTAQTVLIMFGYALGMFLPLAAVIFGGQRLGSRLRSALGGGRRVLAPMGVVLIATAFLIGVGGLDRVNRFIAENINLTSTPTAALEQRALVDQRRRENTVGGLTDEQLAAGGYPETAELDDLGPAPSFDGISRWYNSRPLTMRGLRGKVVLIDFWTYSCINCIRTFPHLRGWHDRYADDGLVIVGVHSPEFEFEKDPGNVGRAVRDFDIEYAVALDPDHRTWDNFFNRYWPAHYLIDKDGTIRSVHYGEGEYAETENEIKELLGEDGDPSRVRDDPFTPRTPETYLGFERAERFQDKTYRTKGLVPDREAEYRVPRDGDGEVSLEPDVWSFDGSWLVGPQGSVAGRDASIYIRFRGRKVHIVAGPAAETSGTISADVYEGGRDVVVDEYKLYTVRSGDDANALLRLDVSPGVEVFAFTFG